MVKTRFYHYRLAALCAVLAIVLAQGAGALNATASQSDNPFKNVNLRAEAQTVDRFCEALEKLDKDIVVARRKPSITHEDFNKLRDKASELKRRWFEVKQAVRSTMTKLNAADLWRGFDNLILPRIGDAKVRDYINTNGGLKRAFEEALSYDPETDPSFHIEKILRPKLTAQVRDLRFERGPQALGFSAVEVTYNPAALKFGTGLMCLGATIRKGISSTINEGGPSDKASCMFTCRCIAPEMGCSHCDGL